MKTDFDYAQTTTTNALSIARDLIARGYAPVPVPIGKSPKIKQWQHLTITEKNLTKYFNGSALNVGAIWGPKSNNRWDTDLDCIEAVKLAPYFLPKTESIYGRPSKRRSHYLYQGNGTTPNKATVKWSDENQKVIIELRFGGGGKGAQSVMPGSKHPSGEFYQWDTDGELGKATFEELRAAAAKIATGTLLVRNWPPANRHDASLRVGGFLARAGWTAEAISDFMVAVQEVAHNIADGGIDHEAVENGRKAAVDAHAAFERGDTNVYGLPALSEFFGDKVAKTIAKHVGFGYHAMGMRAATEAEGKSEGVSFADFYAYMPDHDYIFTPTREHWPASSVNSRLPSVPVLDDTGLPKLDEEGKEIKLSANKWLDGNKPIEQRTWAPGRPMVIPDQLIAEGGWIERKGVSTFNIYRPPTIELGDPSPRASRHWLWLIRKVYPDNADHIIKYLAHRVQRPAEKINHSLVLGGEPGIGKDSILEPVKRAVGPWNFIDVSPKHLLGDFNSYVRSVILRISEAHDLGEMNRFQFYDHTKTLMADPPDVLRCNEKNKREHYLPNVCGVIITTNHKTDGIYLPANDRRHYVAWSDLAPEYLTKKYWERLWAWYNNGGDRHVAAYLKNLDLSPFNPKAPPPKTPTFWAIVDANRAPEESELADVIDGLCNPDAFTLQNIVDATPEGRDLGGWIRDRRNRRAIPHRLEKCGYVPVRNEADKSDGQWRVGGKRVTIYVKASLPLREQIGAAENYKVKMDKNPI